MFFYYANISFLKRFIKPTSHVCHLPETLNLHKKLPRFCISNIVIVCKCVTLARDMGLSCCWQRDCTSVGKLRLPQVDRSTTTSLHTCNLAATSNLINNLVARLLLVLSRLDMFAACRKPKTTTNVRGEL